jgi:hypothetical protein
MEVSQRRIGATTHPAHGMLLECAGMVRRAFSQFVTVSAYFGIGALFYGHFEGWAPLDTCYFLVVTMTTVGYGDFCPSTTTARLFTCAYSLLGMTIAFSALSPLVEGLLSWLEKTEEKVIRFLEKLGLRAPKPPVDPDNELMSSIATTINYAGDYLRALIVPLAVLFLGIILGRTLLENSWADAVYWALITMCIRGAHEPSRIL